MKEFPTLPLIPENALHAKLDRLLRESYLDNPIPGFRLPSERSLALKYGVSVPTLRKVIKRLVVEGRLDQRQGSGTFVRARPPKLVGILCNSDLSAWQHPQAALVLLYDCQRRLMEKGFQVQVYLGVENSGPHRGYSVPEKFCADVEGGLLGGVIALETFPTPGWMSLLEKYHVPVVGKGELHMNMATLNHLSYILKAAQRLRELGRTRVAYIGSPETLHPGHRYSYSGASAVWDHATIRNILEGAGLEMRDEWYHADWKRNLPGKSWSALREIWTAAERPNAVILESPYLAEDAFLAAHECGIAVPEQLSIVGSWMTDTHEAPPLTWRPFILISAGSARTWSKWSWKRFRPSKLPIPAASLIALKPFPPHGRTPSPKNARPQRRRRVYLSPSKFHSLRPASPIPDQKKP